MVCPAQYQADDSASGALTRAPGVAGAAGLGDPPCLRDRDAGDDRGHDQQDRPAPLAGVCAGLVGHVARHTVRAGGGRRRRPTSAARTTHTATSARTASGT